MTDSSKWKSVMVRAEDYELLKDLSDFRRQKLSVVMTDLIQAQWDKAFPPIPRPKEISGDRPKNPFLSAHQPNTGVDR